MPGTPVLKSLTIDTSSPRGSVALLSGSQTVAELRLCSMATHSARLLAQLEFLLNGVGWKLADLDLLAAGIGPGSFSGIRIGVATALGLAQTLSIPYAGISCLDALATQARGLEGRIGAVMDAQRSQVYYAEYFVRQGRVRKTHRPVLLSPDELRFRLRRSQVYVVGGGAELYAAVIAPSTDRWPRLVQVDLYLAAAIGRLALARKRSWKSGEFLQSDPLYIRPPDALRRKVRRR